MWHKKYLEAVSLPNWVLLRSVYVLKVQLFMFLHFLLTFVLKYLLYYKITITSNFADISG